MLIILTLRKIQAMQMSMIKNALKFILLAIFCIEITGCSKVRIHNEKIAVEKNQSLVECEQGRLPGTCIFRVQEDILTSKLFDFTEQERLAMEGFQESDVVRKVHSPEKNTIFFVVQGHPSTSIKSTVQIPKLEWHDGPFWSLIKIQGLGLVVFFGIFMITKLLFTRTVR